MSGSAFGRHLVFCLLRPFLAICSFSKLVTLFQFYSKLPWLDFTENLRFLSSVASFTFWALLLASTTTSRAAHTGCFGCTPYSVGTINMSTKMWNCSQLKRRWRKPRSLLFVVIWREKRNWSRKKTLKNWWEWLKTYWNKVEMFELTAWLPVQRFAAWRETEKFMKMSKDSTNSSVVQR